AWLAKLSKLGARGLRHAADALDRSSSPRGAVPAADERTIRSIGERIAGGLSSKDSDARLASGENPGGLHQKRVPREGPEHQRPKLEEPEGRQELGRRRERHLREMRRGS